jgi:hypothetical protein
MDIKLQPVGHVQQAQAAVPEQAEKLPSYSERYYDDYFEYRCESSLVARFDVPLVMSTATAAIPVLTGRRCRHVSLTMEQAQRLPKPMRILNEVCRFKALGHRWCRASKLASLYRDKHSCKLYA